MRMIIMIITQHDEFIEREKKTLHGHPGTQSQGQTGVNVDVI